VQVIGYLTLEILGCMLLARQREHGEKSGLIHNQLGGRHPSTEPISCGDNLYRKG